MRPFTSIDASKLHGGLPVSARTSLTPLTGRNTEVGLLTDRWEQAQEGAGQAVLIVGEAGLGKSRLVDTIKDVVLAERGDVAVETIEHWPIIDWQCAQRSQDSGLHPVSQCLKRLLNFGVAETSAERFDRLASYLDHLGLGEPGKIALFARLLFLPADERYPTPTLTPAREREATFCLLNEWLAACARLRPILFIVEDLQWIDASTLEFLERFVRAGLHEGILTVLTCRPEFQVPWPVTAYQTSLALSRLSRRQVAELMRKCAGGSVPDSLVTQIYERTGGVPLLVEEFTRLARESAIFEQVTPHEIPATLQQLVMARLDRLASNREVAHFAATLGREFEYEMLAAVVSVDEPTLQAELAKLAHAEILFRKGAPPNCAYLFKHALLEEALHTALEVAERQQFHRRVAEVMEAQFPQAAETHPELLALHFSEAGVAERAIGYWLLAGRRSQARCAHVEAISHLQRGLELLRGLEDTPARDLRELEFLGVLGTAYIAARGYAAPEVGPIFHRARTLSERGGQTPQGFVMLRGHFAYHIVRGDFRLCTELAAQAMQWAELSNDPGMLMEALFLQGLTQLYRGDFAGAYESCRRALDDYDDRARTAFWAAQTGEDSGVAHRCYLALACWYLGSPERAFALNREARDLARTLRHPFSLEYALHHTGWLHQHARLGLETEDAGHEEMRIAVEQGFLFWHASGTLYVAAGLLLRGRVEDGLALLQKGLDAYRATGAELGLPYYLSILGETFLRQGAIEEARRALDEAFVFAEKNDERFHEAELHRLRGELALLESGDGPAAEACFRQALTVARQQRSRAWELRTTLALARLWHRQGNRHKAYSALTAIHDVFADAPPLPDLVEAAAFLRELGDERMRDDIAAGIKYVRGCIPPPIARADGPVAVDWRYIPSSTLGGDTFGYHWVDANHLALYLLDVTGHGLDSALLAVTITNVIRSGALAGADPRQPDEVLRALNQAFQGAQHGHKYFTIWYGVYHTGHRVLRYASGGHPPAVVVVPGEAEPILHPATGPVMGIFPQIEFPAAETAIPAGSRLYLFSDGVFEIRRQHRTAGDLNGCIAHLVGRRAAEGNSMDTLLLRARELRGSLQLDDDFSIIEARFQ